MSSICPGCNKRVYWAERVTAVGSDWHPLCYSEKVKQTQSYDLKSPGRSPSLEREKVSHPVRSPPPARSASPVVGRGSGGVNFCPSCGTKAAGGSFCISCGARLG